MGSLEQVEDEFHRPEEEKTILNGENPGGGDENGNSEGPLELTTKRATEVTSEPTQVPAPTVELAQEIEIKTEETEDVKDSTELASEAALVNNEETLAETQGRTLTRLGESVIQEVPGHGDTVPMVEENIDVMTTDETSASVTESVVTMGQEGVPGVHGLEYAGAGHSGGHVVYQEDGGYIEYSYEDGSKAGAEASVQVEYIGSADGVVTSLGDNVEYVTLTGEGEAESRVIGVLRDTGNLADYNSVPYYTIRASEDPIQAVILSCLLTYIPQRKSFSGSVHGGGGQDGPHVIFRPQPR